MTLNKMNDNMKIVVALGGNALMESGSAETTSENQHKVVMNTCNYLAELVERGYKMAIVHGNGPQVGRIVLASEYAKDVTPAMPFDVCGAMSQGVHRISHPAMPQIRIAKKRNKNSCSDYSYTGACFQRRPGFR